MGFIKKLIAALICAAVLTAATVPAMASGISVLVDGAPLSFDMPPVIQDGRTLVPYMALFEALGADVEWYESEQTVIAYRGDITITLKVGSETMEINGQQITLDVPVQNVNGSILVPVRAIAESLGADVRWAQNTETVTIRTLETAYGFDIDAAFATFAPDTPMIVSDYYTTTWAEFFARLFMGYSELYHYYGVRPDFTESLDDMSLGEALLDFAVEGALDFFTYRYGADLNEITFDDESLSMLASVTEEMIEFYGGAEAFSSALWYDNGVRSLELYNHIISHNYLQTLIFTELYGSSGELFPIEAVERYALERGFLNAKHILFIVEFDEEREQKYEEAMAVLNQLKSYDGSDLDALFDELMFEYSDDIGGVMSFPHGYLFEAEDMIPEFHSASAALDIGAFSDLVETPLGYHIIYRLPINHSLTPFGRALMGDETSSLRQIAAEEAFGGLLSEWRDAIQPVFTAEFESIDLFALFR